MPYWLQAPAYGDLRLTVHTVPDAVQLEKTFPLTCKVVNCWSVGVPRSCW